MNALTKLPVHVMLVGLIFAAPLRLFAAEIMVQQSHDLQIDYDRQHARLALAAMQRLWLMPGHGGTAQAMTPIGLTLREPRFSPSGEQLVASGGWQRGAQHLWLIDLASRAITQLTDGAWRDTAPAWHPDGEHIVFTSDRGGSQDIWQLGVITGDTFALTRTRGNAFDAAINARADQLLYAYEERGQHAIMARGYAMTDRHARTLVSTTRPVAKPRIRHNGVSITYFDSAAGQQQLNLLLPIREMLSKTLHGGRTLSDASIAWRDRDHYFAVDDGRIVLRQLATERVVPVPMTIWLSTRDRQSDARAGPGPAKDAGADDEWILRADRVLAADGRSYLSHRDVLIRGDQIVTVRAQQAANGINVVDLGDVTIIPGLIDVRRNAASAPEALRLAAGVTLEVTSRAANLEDLTHLTDNRDRLNAIDNASAQTLTLSNQLLPDVLAGVDWVTLSGVLPEGSQSLTPMHALLLGRAQITIPSEIAATLGVPAHITSQLSRSRLFRGQTTTVSATRPAQQSLTALAPWLVAATGNSPIAAPLALHAELMIMQDAGMPPADVLAMATSRAATAIGRDDLGSIAPGKTANLVAVTGDPLLRAGDLVNTVAVIDHGTFTSVARLLELSTTIVE